MEEHSFNTLFFTAFLILIFDPLSLFDVGFQMSFAAVFSILYFSPTLRKTWTPKYKISQYIWSLLIVSISAQLGIFPIALFHFGTFPTYFFFANLAVVPLISLTIYILIPLFLISPFINKSYYLIHKLQFICQYLIKKITHAILQITYWIEGLPHSQLENIQINIFQALFLTLIVYMLFAFFKKGNPKQLILLLLLVLSTTISFYLTELHRSPPQLVIFNTPDSCDIAIYIKNKRHYFEYPNNGFLPIKERRVLLLSENTFSSAKSNKQLSTDILIISSDPTFSIQKLNTLFSPKIIIFDNTTPLYIKNKWKKAARTLDVPFHDVTENGAFVINL